MAEVRCPGLPAHWVNGWLAAVGATVLVPGMRLRWSEDQTPMAMLSVDGGDPVESLVDSWPDEDSLRDLPVANRWKATSPLKRSVPADAFVARARAARNHTGSWSLSSTLTDLLVERNGEVAHGRFDPPAPRGLTLWERLMSVHRQVVPEPERLKESLAGRAARVKANGLGFDIGRLGSLGDDSEKWVDPVVETLAFFGLALLPVRSTGVDLRRGGRRGSGVAQRGWKATPGVVGGPRFMWPAWTPDLDRSAIDALLDVWGPDQKESWDRLGVRAGWQSVSYQRRALQDVTRAIGSERL